MAEYGTTDNPHFVDFEGGLVNGNVDTNDPILNQPPWWDLDYVGDQFTSPEFMPWDPPRPDINPLEDTMPVFEEFSMNIDPNLGIEFGFDASTTLEQAKDLTEPLNQELSVPNEGSLDNGMIVNYVPKETRLRLDQTQVDMLSEWVADCPTPYPTKKEKLNLSRRTGLKISQISSWFSRARQKLSRRVRSEHSPAVPVAEPSVQTDMEMEIPRSVSNHESYQLSRLSLPVTRANSTQPSAAIQRCRSLPSCFSLDHLQKPTGYPMTGWSVGASLDVVLSSHTEHSSSNSPKAFVGNLDLSLSRTTHSLQSREHSKQSYIHEWLRRLPINTIEMNIAQQNEFHPGNLNPLPSAAFGITQPESSSSGSIQNRSNYDADDGLDSSSVAWSAAWSAGLSASSAGSRRSLGSRKGRRIFVDPSSNRSNRTRKRGLDTEAGENWRTHKKSRPTSPNSSSSNPWSLKYFCTFCKFGFSRPFLWRRHEESAHAPQKKWICGPPCPICEQLRARSHFDPTLKAQFDICSHGFCDCWAKPEADRTFFRKDAFRQHLGTVHTRTNGRSWLVQYELDLDNWFHEVDTSGYDLKCYFCGVLNDDWNARCEHIIKHFKNGATIDKWSPAVISLRSILASPGPNPVAASHRFET
ncbi:hypothetical protein F4678DRAFT_241552 [Xylaria arbuscula]|nr:hypothetical protein F4678DRAFT_241552 [Xylaria arbuscula]